METNNNLSVLPWYTSVEQQNARKWWMYDKVYPLFAQAGYLPPFQITVPKSVPEVITMDFRQPDTIIPELTPGNIGGKIYVRDELVLVLGGIPAESVIYQPDQNRAIRTTRITSDTPIIIAKAYSNIEKIEFLNWRYLSGEGFYLVDPEQGTMDNNTGVFTADGDVLFVSLYTGTLGVAFDAIRVTFKPIEYIISAQLKDASGVSVMDISNAMGNAMTVKTIGDNDIFVYTGNRILSELENGQYYIDMSIYGQHYYSEVFTVVNDISGYLKLEWWNNADFVMDAGTIVYKDPDFKNVLYLCSDIAKPEYDFSDEVVERDGYTFPVVQISKKIYRFSFWASEYLLDVMRLIRMADNIVIMKDGRTYDKIDSFLLTPDWEKEGDIASVDVEFTTDTVAKKNGNTYVIG